MTKPHYLCLAATLLLTIPGFAEKPAAPPGQTPPPSTSSAGTVVDSTGKLVGEILKLEAGGLTTVSVKYPLPTGDFVVMAVNADGITNFGQRVRERSDPQTAELFFTTADCSGDAYLFRPTGSQLTKRQAIVLDALQSWFNPAPSNGCQAVSGADRWLFASDALACWTMIPEGTAITFHSYYGTNMSDPNPQSNCASLQGGYSMPNPQRFENIYKVYHRVEDLSIKFQPPFYVP